MLHAMVAPESIALFGGAERLLVVCAVGSRVATHEREGRDSLIAHVGRTWGIEVTPSVMRHTLNLVRPDGPSRQKRHHPRKVYKRLRPVLVIAPYEP